MQEMDLNSFKCALESRNSMYRMEILKYRIELAEERIINNNNIVSAIERSLIGTEFDVNVEGIGPIKVKR